MTLLEILVVISIVALLAAIAVPSTQRIRANARSTKCVAKLRGVGIGLSNYFLDRGTTFPTLVTARESRDEDVPAIDTVLLDYVQDEFVFQCPSDHEGLFEKTGSSYFWNSLINGQRLGNMDLLGLTRHETGIPVASDKENFHEDVGDGVNVLYADGHVLRELQFVVGPR
ncbi:MAG: type II secretion system protein [Verrucomicrobiales bacterium]